MLSKINLNRWSRRGEYLGETLVNGKPSNENSSSSSIVHQQQVLKHIKFDVRHSIRSVAFLVDENHVVSGCDERKIRRWRVEDGKEVVGTSMDAGSTVVTIAVSRDGKLVVSGMIGGEVMVWNAESHEKVIGFKGHSKQVFAVDVSPDATKVVTGSEDKTACVWSLSTGHRLLGPLKHDNTVVATKFSPNGHLVATATWDRYSIRIYDSQNDQHLVDFPIRVNSAFNQSLAWASDNKQLFALSYDGAINRLDVSTGTAVFQWPIHSNKYPTCIALASNGTFVAASGGSSVSFWDTTTHKQIGQVIQDDRFVQSMTISPNGLATGGDKTITLHSLCDILPRSYFGDSGEQGTKRTSEDVDDEDRGESIPDLEEAIRKLRQELDTSQLAANCEKDSLNEIIKSLRTQNKNLNDEIAQLKESFQELRTDFDDTQHKADSLGQLLHAHERKHQCEVLYNAGRIIDAAKFLLEIVNTLSEDVRTNKLFTDWLPEFTSRCISMLEILGDKASSTKKHDEALEAYSVALFLGPPIPNAVLVKWASVKLIRSSANETLGAAVKFKIPSIVIYQTICDNLERDGRVMEAVEYFRQMQSGLEEYLSIHDECEKWELNFRRRCTERLEKLGDIAVECRSYNEATKHFSTLLSLNPVNRMDVLIKRSKARMLMGSCEEALSDADEIINLDESSFRGYEVRHAALHGARRHAEAVEAFRTMLEKIEQSPYEDIRECRGRYFDAKPTIRRVVEQTIRYMPRVLIDTATGRLHDKKQQAAAFEAHPNYDELVSSMTTEPDFPRISRTVKEFYRYVMLSHTWETDEPLLQQVEHLTVYELESSPVNTKLQTFCLLVRSLGFLWAWSDTCCVDKVNNVVLQESLVAMFTWYRSSSLTVVYLRGVSSESQVPGGLQGSIWNTRAWTYQEYVAAETIQFYTEDWKPYLGLTLSNHKESPSIISEMQQATGVSAQQLAVFHPGLDSVREKLYLASLRQTTLPEDIAYSLLGIFNVAIPVIYGEGDRAVGRLLEHILTGSGDVTILAWTGRAGNYNSCLPIDLTVYDQLMPLHIPQPMNVDEMDSMITALRSSLPNLSLAVKMYNRLNDLPSPSLAASRLRLPGIVFRLTELVHAPDLDPVTNLRVYHATTTTFGDIEIKTADDLTGMKDLHLVHPWIRPLLDQEFLHGAATLDKTTQALRFAARLRQPFGALLFQPVSRVEYKRVAADSLIMVQIREGFPLTDLIGNVHPIEVQ
ncbi:hypothetical protein J3R82DRAFT_11026 [Butyriboletus roseoflavus]|nr:hypothetical protein J3R82DRAFT_11026 [Butyriboletus roseoflavus]